MRRTISEHLSVQSLVYISAGVFLTISHNLYEYLILRYFGYMLLSISIIILLTIPVFEFSNIPRISRELRLFFRRFTRRIAVELDNLFIRILPMLTITALFFAILNEIVYVNKLREQGDSSISAVEEANLEVVLIIVGVGILLYIIVQILPFFIRRWRIGVIFILSTILFIILNSLKTPPIFLALYLFLILLFPVLLSTRRDTRRRVWRSFYQAAARIFFLISIVLFFAGIPAAFSKVFSLNDFWGKSLCLLCLSSAFSLRLSILPIYFPLAERIIFKAGLVLLLAGILYIWVVAFNSEILWALVTWLICFVVSLSPEIFSNRRISLSS